MANLSKQNDVDLDDFSFDDIENQDDISEGGLYDFELSDDITEENDGNYTDSESYNEENTDYTDEDESQSFSENENYDNTISNQDVTNNTPVENAEDANKVENLVLYIITDKHVNGMLSYFRYYGANVSQIFTNLDEAKSVLLMQVEPSRIVVIDAGTGRFTNMGTRRELVDLLGISDEENKIAVFYTDSVIKSEVEGSMVIEDREIEWFKYRSTSDVLAHLLQNKKKENYVLDMEQEDESTESNVLNITGLKVPMEGKIDLGEPILNPIEIATNLDTESDVVTQLPGYEIRV